MVGMTLFFFTANYAVKEAENAQKVMLPYNKKGMFPYNYDISLSEAIQLGSPKLVDAAIQKGAQLNKLLSEKKPPLILASEQDLTDNMKKIIIIMVKKGAQVDQRDEFGQTALMIAAAAGRPSVVKFLVEQGANIALENNDGKTAIELTHNKDIKQYLIKTLESQNIKKQGIWARITGSASQKVLDAKPEAQVFVWARDNAGSKDRNLATLRQIISGYKTEDKRIKAINFKGPYDYSALHYAVVHGDEELIKFLLDNGADILIHDAHGQTPLAHIKGILDSYYDRVAKTLYALLAQCSDEYRERTGVPLTTAINYLNILKQKGISVDKSERKKYLCDKCIQAVIDMLTNEKNKVYWKVLLHEKLSDLHNDFTIKIHELAAMAAYFNNYIASIFVRKDADYAKNIESGFLNNFQGTSIDGNARALRGLYEMIGVPRDAPMTEVLSAIKRKSDSEQEKHLWRQMLFMFDTEAQKEEYDAFLDNAVQRLADKSKKHIPANLKVFAQYEGFITTLKSVDNFLTTGKVDQLI